MPFTSTLRRNEQIFDDTTKEHEQVPVGVGRGLILPRARGTTLYMYGVPEFPAELLIPRSEWQARIQEQEETRTRVSDVIDRAGLPCKDQEQTNYCWANSPVHCIEVSRCLAHQPEMVILSPASVAAPIKNFQNEGGWGKEALDYLVAKGCVPIENWPANAIERKYMTTENATLALLYKAVGWYELQPRNYDEHISALLWKIPCSVGLNYWGHQVTDYEAVWIDGEALPRFRNSWGMNWPEQGAGGYGVRRGSKKYADDIVCPAFARAA